MTVGKAHRGYHQDVDGVLRHYGNDARIVVLWRQNGGPPPRSWTYIARVDPADRGWYKYESFFELMHARFGGGQYKAKIYGEWITGGKREEYLEQVSFGIAGAPTDHTVAMVERAGHRI